MKTPSLPDLRAFVMVSKLESFAAAAQALHLSQPALSRRVAGLEEVLGVRLLDRTTRSVALTSAGRRFLADIGQVLGDLDRSIMGLHDVARLEAGDVTIGCIFSVVHHFLLEVIGTFREQHPRVMVRLVEESGDEVLASVKSGQADFAISYTGMHDPDVEFTALLKEPFVLACRPEHPLAGRRTVRWEDLGDHPYALVSHESRIRFLIDQALERVGRLPRPVCEVRHVSTLIGMVETGLAVAVVPQLTLPNAPAPVVGVRLEQPVITRTVGMLRRRGRSLSPAAEALAGILLGAIRARNKALGRTRARRS
ncbi:LysR family transcriptional regulator [Ramlibacter tataouinensis]|uniref:Transcriptional regulator, LysR family-like protein n=1 Tax=Ramlibacter tataouinensis (strain ATCC BAA-407 / DSM 14655 / LMG 21543 / TTB310) TaxID=365046 RepID=F5XWA8_RAMTT|nr:LysR family transcriptional regulator [Ramlibacter tataouinensis]AEG91678.1 transcriptional regulator, LysR family-like protein [Ramlibacter tataouinensis TTB310]